MQQRAQSLTFGEDRILRWANIGMAACTVGETELARFMLGVVAEVEPGTTPMPAC